MNGRNVKLELLLDSQGRACGASGDIVIAASRDAVWKAMQRLDGYGERIAMVESIERRGSEAVLNLKFRVSFLSKRFSVRSRLHEDAPKSLRFEYLSGEPRNAELRLELSELSERECKLAVYCGYDLDSLGWVVTYFLKHHPEIRAGVFAGTVFSVASAMRDMAEHR